MTKPDRLISPPGNLEKRLAHLGRSLAGSRLDLGLAWGLLALWVAAMVAMHWDDFPPDFSSLYLAGKFLAEGRADLVYAAPPHFFGGPPDSWQPTIVAIGGPEAISFPYIYPPLWAALFAPLSERFDLYAVTRTALVLQTSLLALAVMIAAQLMKPRTWPLTAWAALYAGAFVFFLPPQIALMHNQPTISMIFLVLLSLERLTKGRQITAGAALALAAAIKLTPAAFAVIFLVERQYRALAAFAAVGGALGMLSLVLAGVDLHLTFLQSLDQVKSATVLATVNISVLGAAASAIAAFDPAAHAGLAERFEVLFPLPGWLGPSVSLMGLCAILLCWWSIRREAWPRRIILSYLAIGIIIPLFGPLGWQHYYVLPLMLLPAAVARLSPAAALRLVAGVAAMSLWLTAAFFQQLPWPAAIYVWVLTLGWLGILATVAFGASREPQPADRRAPERPQ